MPEPAAKRQFLPSLLDRLTDNEPDSRQEAPETFGASRRQLRDAVLRDLTSLLNTGNFESVEDLKLYPYVARSALNYGIPDLTGWTASGVSVEVVEKAVQKAIREFEPRILPHSLTVRGILAVDRMNKNALGFEIRGLLWGVPLPSSMLVRTEVDLETGHVEIKEFSAF